MSEQAIARLVDTFYDRARADDLLGPVLDDAIHDWPEHLAIFRAFWERTLLGTGAPGRGHPFAAHAHLPVEPEHFDRWLDLFRTAARETLTPDMADQAIRRAEHMSASFMTGMFPFKDARGRPARRPGGGDGA